MFKESSRAFLLDTDTGKPSLALDLGCGPGYSTHLLADILHCNHVAGFDNSEHFISLARKTETKKVSFYLYDITNVPFPVGPSELLFCRFLFTHLKEPQTIIMKWATQLQAGGLLLVEEVECIHTTNAIFTTYIGIVEAMLEHQSNKLHVGPVLNSLEDTDILKRRMSRVKHLPVTSDSAATMFFLNMRTWKNHPFIQKNYSPMLINQLQENLHALMKEPGSQIEIEWGIRQLVYERV